MRFVNVMDHYIPLPVLRDAVLVIDAGANVGSFARKVRAYCPKAKILCIEPNKYLAQAFEELDNVVLIQKALASKPGTVRFFVDQNPEASSVIASNAVSHQIEVQSDRLVSILDQHDVSSADLLKLDIEGAEIDVLLDCSPQVLRRFKAISVEFHDFVPALGVTTIDVQRAISHLRAAGFYSIKFSRMSHLDVLFLRNDTISRTEAWFSANVMTFILGLGRRLKKLFTAGAKAHQ